MKVTNLLTSKPQRSHSSSPAPRPSDAGPIAARGRGRADSVSVSDVASQLAAALERADETEAEGVSTKRFEALKVSVRSGTYPVDIRALAESIVHKDLF